MSDLPRHVRLSLLGVVLAMPGLTYWIVGDLSAKENNDRLDHMWRAPVSGRAAAVIGLACLLAAISGSAVVLSSRSARLRAGRAWSTALLIVAGIIFGAGLRVTTAGVDGANIGGGLYVLFGLPDRHPPRHRCDHRRRAHTPDGVSQAGDTGDATRSQGEAPADHLRRPHVQETA